jgi:hypothetical protein
VKVRWIGDAVPGLLVYSSLHRPLICSEAVGACKQPQVHYVTDDPRYVRSITTR